jgi:hypothetical protein
MHACIILFSFTNCFNSSIVNSSTLYFFIMIQTDLTLFRLLQETCAIVVLDRRITDILLKGLKEMNNLSLPSTPPMADQDQHPYHLRNPGNSMQVSNVPILTNHYDPAVC